MILLDVSCLEKAAERGICKKDDCCVDFSTYKPGFLSAMLSSKNIDSKPDFDVFGMDVWS